jgi:hypothetical protein
MRFLPRQQHTADGLQPTALRRPRGPARVLFHPSALILVLALPCLLLAQTTFERTFGGPAADGSNAVCEDGWGSGYYLTGFTRSFGADSTDLWLIGAAPDGESLWTRAYGGPGFDAGCAVLGPWGCGFAVAGYVDSLETGGPDAWLLRGDMMGNTLWTRRYGGAGSDAAYSLAQTEDDGYILAGFTTSFGAGMRDFYLVRTDEDGDTLWTRTCGGTEDDVAFSVVQTFDGGYVVAGMTNSFGAGGNDVYLVRADEDGNIRWTQTCGGTEDDIGQAIIEPDVGDYVLVGSTASTGAGGFDAWLIRIEYGITVWTRTYGGPDDDYGQSVSQTADGGYVICGTTWSFGAGESDLWLIRTDSVGDTLWTRTYGGSDIDYGSCVVGPCFGGYILCGGTASFGNGGLDAYFIMTDSAGNVSTIFEVPRPAQARPLRPTLLNRARLLAKLQQDPTLSLFDATGRTVRDPKIIPPGIYFVRQADSGTRTPVRKVVISD